MINGLIDQDIRPSEPLVSGLEDRIRLDVGASDAEHELASELENVPVLFTTSRLPLTERVLESATELEFIGKIGTGIDSVDLQAAAECGVTVTYTPGLNALAVAEHAVALLLAVNRNVLRGQRTLEDGRWRDEMPMSHPIAQQTIGIIGFGNVGSRVAGLLSGFQTKTLAYDPYVHDIDAQITGTELVSLEELLTSADAVVVAAELTDETRGLIDANALDLMADHAILVNTARGPIVDQSALLEALHNGSIRGAGLDVFETEPLPAGSPLHDLENVVTTPHIAATTERSRLAAIETLIDLVTAYLDDEQIGERFVATRPS